MAGKGPAPKAELSRANDQKRRDAESIEVASDGSLRGPDLPERPKFYDVESEEWATAAWPDQTVAWWLTWRRSAQALAFVATDWDFLLDTALLHAAMWDGDTKAAPELRLRVAKFGATVEDRARLKIKIDGEASQAAAQPPAQIDDARALRLLKAAGDES